MVTPRNSFSDGGVMAGIALHGQKIFAEARADVDAAVGPGGVGVSPGIFQLKPVKTSANPITSVLE